MIILFNSFITRFTLSYYLLPHTANTLKLLFIIPIVYCVFLILSFIIFFSECFLCCTFAGTRALLTILKGSVLNGCKVFRKKIF